MSIKVCGIGVVSAIGIDCAENLSSLLSGNCGIGAVTLFHTAIGVPVGEVKRTNIKLKESLGIAQNTTVSRTALLGAVAAKEALNDAQIPAGSRIGLISATTVGGMDLSENFYAEFKNAPTSGRLRDIVGHDCASSTEFIARQCGIAGFRTTISTACSSAANAVIMGAQMLDADMLDYVLVGATDALCRFTLNGFNALMILDKGLCRPLDRDRSGLNLGEGAGYLVLAKNPANSYCSLSGYANANDAFHQTASSESGDGAYMSMRGAVDMSGLALHEIDYINLHGTGTINNDSSEMAALGRLFGANVPPCSSTKCYTGHTLAAAGAIEAIYSVLAIENGVRYANLRFENPIEDAASPLTNTQRGVTIKNVLSNSFGFGGNCSSLIFSKE